MLKLKLQPVIKIVKSILQVFLNTMLYFKRFHLVKRKGIFYILDLKESVDRAVFLFGNERRTISYLRRFIKPGHTVIEVGSNVGSHSLIISKIIGSKGVLHAFEPTDFAYEKLLANYMINPHLKKNTNLYQMYVSDNQSNQVEVIRSSWQVGKTVEIEKLMDEKYSGSIITLDEYLSDLNQLDFLKIDVDGFDYKVLTGAKNLIAKFRPKVFIELGEYHLNLNNDSSEDIINFFEKNNYKGELENGEPMPSINHVKEILSHQSHINAFFTPKT
jgi:FkbM family methyltransferase